MIRKNMNGVEWLEFELLQQFPKLRHGVFLRHGGFSHAPYDSFNLSFRCGDVDADVTANWKKLKEVAGIDSIKCCSQVHGDSILEVTSNSPVELDGCDALATSESNIGLLIRHADCQATIFYDPIHHAIANVHAGWRGNVLDLYGKTVSFMKDKYGSKPEDLYVCISPSLGPRYSEFINYREELPESFWKFEEKPLHFNLWEIARDQLVEAGILKEHIQIAEICTVEQVKDFYSFRKEKTTGRNGTLVYKI